MSFVFSAQGASRAVKCGGTRGVTGAVSSSVVRVFLKSALCLAVAFWIAVPAHAWNRVGHMSVAGAAYAQLTARARAQVDDMLRRFPDYALLAEATPADPQARARAVFMKAAYWPDHIKGDARFYDQSAANAIATPTLPGFPHMKRNTGWHYVDLPFSLDGTPLRDHQPPHLLSQLRMILTWRGGAEGEDPVYLLPWLLHLVGDAHQPLHSTARFMKGQVDSNGRPADDQGGNLVILEGDTNLHSLWDGALGRTNTDVYIDGVTALLVKRAPRSAGSLDPKIWIDEGFRVAKQDVYSFGNQTGTKEKPLRLSSDYAVRMKEVAFERAALAAARLAAILNNRP